MQNRRPISIRGARTHNLKNISLDIPSGKMVVISGLSGSGKSSLAFDTLYAEGQRRYVESLSSYARQFLQMMEKPDTDSIDGLGPAISIEQKSASHNPRSTVGTVTEIYDYLRLLFARCGDVTCPTHSTILSAQGVSSMTEAIMEEFDGKRILIAAPVVSNRKGEFFDTISDLLGKGFSRMLIDGETLVLDKPVKLEKNKKHSIEVAVDRLTVNEGNRQRIAESMETACSVSDGKPVVRDIDGETERRFSSKFSCPECSWTMPEPEPRLFSFNSPAGACPSCDGLGALSDFDPLKMIQNPEKTVEGGAISCWDSASPFYLSLAMDVLRHYKVKPGTKWRDIPPDVARVLFNGSGTETIKFSTVSSFSNKPLGTRTFDGIIPITRKRHAGTTSTAVKESFGRFVSSRACPSCNGARLKNEALGVLVGGLSIFEMCEMPVCDLARTLGKLEHSDHRKDVSARIAKEALSRLTFLTDVGLGYLSLSRSAETLSGGESQRIRLASQIGSGLTGVMYVLDEPSIGLHQRDNEKLLSTLARLRDLGNSLIIVEHDMETIMAADHLVDMGPAAGEHGGCVVAQGTPAEVAATVGSPTGDFISGRRSVPLPAKRRKPNAKKWLEISGCKGNNLASADLAVPCGLLTCITGVSGSGKSTIVNDTLFRAVAKNLGILAGDPLPYAKAEGLEHFDKVVNADQSPIGRTPRSNPATYTGVMTHIRDLFSQTRTAKERGYSPGRFSFNVKGGRCETCQGDGSITVEMHFLPDMRVPCETCLGKRFNRETIETLYAGKSICDVLDMTVDEASAFFSSVPPIARKLETLSAVGLGYIRLGQPATTLSGGEAQRVKLSLELAKRDTGKTLYILDEPTTGLHFQDVGMLLSVLNLLVDRGNTVVVIEHNLDVVKNADWIVDIGPEGGAGGGRIVAQGTPETIAKSKASLTGKFLAPVLGKPKKSQIL